MNASYERGFTLIELLVVIAIIGLLSSVVLASLNSSRDKSRVAAGQQSDQSIYHAIGDRLVGDWELDDCSGASASDRSEYRNAGTLVGSPTWSSETPMRIGCSLSFSGGSYAGVSLDQDILDVRTGSATRSMWIKTSQTTQSYLFWKADGGQSNGITIEIGTGSSGVVKCRAKATGSIITVTAPSVYNDDKWHFIVCVLDRGANVLSIYIDGGNRVDADASILAGLDLNSSSGTFFPNNLPAYTGLIDEVRMYSSMLTAQEVGKLYAEGAASHGIALW